MEGDFLLLSLALINKNIERHDTTRMNYISKVHKRNNKTSTTERPSKVHKVHKSSRWDRIGTNTKLSSYVKFIVQHMIAQFESR